MEGVQWRERGKMKRKKNKGSPGFSGSPGPLRAFPGPWDPFGFFGSARRPWEGGGQAFPYPDPRFLSEEICF